MMKNVKNFNNWNVNENSYKNDFKGVKCNFCGQMVSDDYSSKINHIYTKHLEHPKMDGYLPTKEYSPSITVPQGGKRDYQLVKLYFDKN